METVTRCQVYVHKTQTIHYPKIMKTGENGRSFKTIIYNTVFNTPGIINSPSENLNVTYRKKHIRSLITVCAQI